MPQKREKGQGRGDRSKSLGEKQMSAGIDRVHLMCLHGLEMTLVLGDLIEAWWAPFPFSLLTQRVRCNWSLKHDCNHFVAFFSVFLITRSIALLNY